MMTAISAVLLTVSAVRAPENTSARVAELVEQLDDKEAGPRAFRSLVEVGAEAVPQLIRAQRNGDANHRWLTNERLLIMGYKAVPPLIRTLRDKDPAIRKEAAVSLGYLATHARRGGLDPRTVSDKTAPAALSKALKERAVPALTQALDDDDLRVRAAVLDALASIGPDALDALPRLLQFLRDERAELSRELIFAVGQLGAEAKPEFERLLKNKDGVIRERASVALKSVQIAELVRQLQDKESQDEAAPALVQLGPEVVYPILRQLEKEWAPLEGMDHGPDTFLVANAILKKLGAEAVPPLVETLQDGNVVQRTLAASSLGRLGRFVEAAEPALRNAEDNGAVPPFVQGFELSEVVALNEALTETAVPALQIALKDESTGVREFAAMALGNIDRAAKETLPDLLAILTDKDDRAGGFHAVSAIARMGPEAVPGLVSALSHEDVLVRRRAATALGMMGEDRSAHSGPSSGKPVEALPALITALNDEDEGVRSNAAYAIGRMGMTATDALPALIQALTEERGDMDRYSAVSALGELGPEAKEAVPTLIKLLRDDNALLRQNTVAALGNVGPDAKDAVPALTSILQDSEDDLKVRAEAARALGRIGPSAKRAIPSLIHMLDHEQHWTIRGSAARALGNLGPEAKEAVPALIRALRDEHPWADPAVVATAVGMVPPFPDHQLAVFREKQDGVRVAAAWALGQLIGPDAKEAILALEEALHEDNERIRSQTEKTLRRVDPNWEP